MLKWFLILLVSTGSYASPVSDLSKIGQGEMTYLFWTIYHAEYFRTQQANGQNAAANSRALKITYQKSIKSQDLIEATADQWLKLGFSAKDIQSWIKPLQLIWPDVTPGNTLTIVVTEQDVSHFYFNDENIGTVSDTRFGDAFLSIWLSENTSQPGLRRQLLGLAK